MTYAQTSHGQIVDPSKFSDSEWQELKNSYRVGDYLFACCKSPAIPKTSINGVRFFAHQSDECSSAPETQWHISAKDYAMGALIQMGANPILEKPIDGVSQLIKPDVHFRWNGRVIALEIQHSYQTLNEYLRRQKRYEENRVEAYWILYQPRYMTLCKALARFRLKRDLNGVITSSGYFPLIEDLPMVMFRPEQEGGKVDGAGFFQTSFNEWLEAIINRRFVYRDGVWLLAKG